MKPDSNSPMIEAFGLTKRYNSFPAVLDATFSVRAGEVVAFLGPNGAGKTTTMKMLTGFLAPTSGSARVAGLDVFADRLAAVAHIGYLPESGPLYTDMTPQSLLSFFGRSRGFGRTYLRERIDAVSELCGIGDVMAKRIGKLSSGYRRRVGLANALLHEPDVLILDEPTNGLDPNQISQVRETLSHIGKKNTILLSTHVLQEVEAVATRVLMITEGRIVFDGKPAELAAKGGKDGMAGAFRELTFAAPVN
jgi:gliding motility-associated transport system ATP-binding protein